MSDTKTNNFLNSSLLSSTSEPLMSELTSSQQMQILDELNKLLEILPSTIRAKIKEHPQHDNLIEVVMDLGRLPEARFSDRASYLGDIPVSAKDLSYSIERVGHFSGDNRAGIEGTLHRISAIRNRSGEIIGLT